VLLSFPMFIKSLGSVFLLKSGLAFPAFLRGFIPSPDLAARGAAPGKPKAFVSRAVWARPLQAGGCSREGTHLRRQGERKAFERLLPPSPQLVRDRVGFHPLPARPMHLLVSRAGREDSGQPVLPLPTPQLLLSPAAGLGAKWSSSSYSFTGTAVLICFVC